MTVSQDGHTVTKVGRSRRDRRNGERNMAIAELSDTQLLKDAIAIQLADIDDPQMLNAFLTLATKYHKPKPLTAAQLEDFEIGRQQIAAGLTFSHEDVMKELDELYPDDED